jgi:protein SCO1
MMYPKNTLVSPSAARRGFLYACTLAALSACQKKPATFNSIDLTGADYARDFKLQDHNGQTRQIADFKGKIVMVFFGFTQCPDVCPTSMAEMAEIIQSLGPQAEKFQGLFISVDPARDKPEVLKAYMANFHPSFLALIPSESQLAETAKEFKIFYRQVPGKTPTSYTMEHTAGSYIFDMQGRVRLYSRYGSKVSDVTNDIKTLLAS